MRVRWGAAAHQTRLPRYEFAVIFITKANGLWPETRAMTVPWRSLRTRFAAIEIGVLLRPGRVLRGTRRLITWLAMAKCRELRLELPLHCLGISSREGVLDG